ncbi:fimbrial protein [Lelliottia sp.]|uniref:fimbrial protein n=1 Tax=Lelliottia sp. TaxID=1898429 RepID=UPI003890126F
MKIIKLISLLFVLWTSASYADCNLVTKALWTVNIPPVTVQRDTPVGTVLWQGYAPYTTAGYIGCNHEGFPDSRILLVGSDTGLKTGTSAVYTTNVPGVGYALSYAYDDSWSTPKPFPSETDVGITDGGLSIQGNAYVRLIKYAKVESGVLNSGQYGVAKMYHSIDYMEINISASQITSVACSINTPNLTFPIGDVPASSFGNSVGPFTDKTSTQNLGLDCDAEANINVELSGTQNPDITDDSVLALNNQGDAGTAKGLGVQLLYNSVPLKLNDRIVLKKSSGGQETFPITARYYQTKNSVTPGDASTSATVTLTYQ